MTTAVARADYEKKTNYEGLKRLAGPVTGTVQAALPRFLRGSADRFIRCLLTECQKSPQLLDCKPASLFAACIQAAQLGLEIGGPAGQAYIVPRKGTVVLQIGYKGFITLAHRSGKVRAITPRMVRANDNFRVEYGTNQAVFHKPDMGGASEVVGYYTTVVMANGGTDFEFLNRAEAEQHRNRYAASKNERSPWFTHFDEMALKTSILRLSKRLPLSVEWVQAAGLDDAAEREEVQGLDFALPGADLEPDQAHEQQLRGRLDAAQREEDADEALGTAPAGKLFDAPPAGVGYGGERR